MKTVHTLVALAVLGWATAVPAEAETIAIVNGRLLVGDGRVVERGTVVIRDGRIAAAGEGVAVPEGAQRLDADGLWVTPGLIEPYSSIGLIEVGMDAATSDVNEATSAATPELRAVDAINPDSALIGVARVGGITTVHTSPGDVNPINGQTVILDLAGHTVDRMVVDSGTFLVFNLGRGGGRSGGGPGARYPATRMGRVAFIRQSLYDAQAAGHRQEADSRGDAARGGEGPSPRGRNLRNEALQAALEGKVRVLIAAREVPEIRAALALAEEFGLKVVLLNPAHAWKCLDEIRAAGVPVILGTALSLPAADEPYDRSYTLAADLHRAGIPFAFTTGRGHAARTLPNHAAVAVAHGLPADVAFRSLTLESARILGIADRYGSLEAGKVANVVLWDGDPLQHRSRVERVFIRGVEVPSASRQEMLRDRFSDPVDVY